MFLQGINNQILTLCLFKNPHFLSIWKWLLQPNPRHRHPQLKKLYHLRKKGKLRLLLLRKEIFIMTDYALNQQNMWTRHSHYEPESSEIKHSESRIIFTTCVMTKLSGSFTFRKRDRHCRLFGPPYCQFLSLFLSLFSTSVLFLVSFFLLMLLCAVNPRPAIWHHRCLICSYSLGNPVCLLIPSTSTSSILPSYFLFLPQESPVTSCAPSGISWNKQMRDSNVIWTELKWIKTLEDLEYCIDNEMLK